MANYMVEVAKLLGVEFNEIFEYETLPGIPFKFTETGLECLGPAKMSRDIMNEALVRMLTGCSKIKRKPWKPKVDERFYVVTVDGAVIYKYWDNCSNHINYYRLGNCYRTKEEAEANRDRWISFYASDEVLEV